MSMTFAAVNHPPPPPDFQPVAEIWWAEKNQGKVYLSYVNPVKAGQNDNIDVIYSKNINTVVLQSGGYPFSASRTFQQFPHRWRLAQDHYWCINAIEFSPFQPVMQLSQMPIQSIDERKVLQQNGFLTCGNVTPAVSYFFANPRKTPGQAPAHFDFFIKARDQCTLFVLDKQRLLIWDGRVKLFADKTSNTIDWKKIGEADLDLDNEFYAIPADFGFFILAKSGKLFSIDTQQAKPKAKLLWQEKRTQIDFALHDHDQGAYFAFGRKERKAADPPTFFFRIDAKIKITEVPATPPLDQIPDKELSPRVRHLLRSVRAIAVK